jgi:hypothetical protein
MGGNQMADQMRYALEKAKEFYIQKLLNLGIYKQTDLQLYQLTLTEMEAIYKKISK